MPTTSTRCKYCDESTAYSGYGPIYDDFSEGFCSLSCETDYKQEYKKITGPCFYCGIVSYKLCGLATVCVPCRKGIEDMKNGIECAHSELRPDSNTCTKCGMEFMICGPCTEVAGSGENILHTGPECDERDL